MDLNRKVGFASTAINAKSPKVVEAHLESRGYFVCYFAGYKMIEEMRKKVDMDEKEFSNKLFSVGFVSMKCIKMLLEIREKLSWKYCK